MGNFIGIKERTSLVPSACGQFPTDDPGCLSRPLSVYLGSAVAEIVSSQRVDVMSVYYL